MSMTAHLLANRYRIAYSGHQRRIDVVKSGRQNATAFFAALEVEVDALVSAFNNDVGDRAPQILDETRFSGSERTWKLGEVFLVYQLVTDANLPDSAIGYNVALTKAPRPGHFVSILASEQMAPHVAIDPAHILTAANLAEFLVTLLVETASKNLDQDSPVRTLNADATLEPTMKERAIGFAKSSDHNPEKPSAAR